MNKEQIDELEGQDGITFSGGDPFYQVEECIEIAKYIKSKKMNIWCYTGFTYETLIKLAKDNNKIIEFLKLIDVLVDGPSKRDETMMTGYTAHQKLINFKGRKEDIGKIINVKITEAKTWSLNGEKE